MKYKTQVLRRNGIICPALDKHSKMNSLTVVVFFVAVAVACAGVIAPLGNLAAVAAHDSPIVTPGVIAAPGVVAAHHGLLGHPGLIGHHGVIAARAGLVHGHLGYNAYPLLAAGSGIEGQYLHDARGSGLDGQYVHDFTETLFDNGQYHGEIYP